MAMQMHPQRLDLRLPPKWAPSILANQHLPVITALLRAVRLKDQFTAVHCLEVGWLAGLLSAALDLNRKEALTAYWCALLHDVGKVGIHESILRKPGPLTAEEYRQMQFHPEMGRHILLPLGDALGEEVLEGVWCHHERIDGSGYPRGLPASRIPLAARITSVCDAWHAMTVDREYRRAKSPDVAAAELVRGGGTQFDADLVKAFLQHVLPEVATSKRTAANGTSTVP